MKRARKKAWERNVKILEHYNKREPLDKQKRFQPQSRAHLEKQLKGTERKTYKIIFNASLLHT